jgi:restriction system protein
MPVPDFQSLMLPVLRAMPEGDVNSVDLRARVARAVGLNDDDLAQMLAGGRQTTFTNRVAWANVHLQRAGLLDKVRRGTYRLSEQGRRVLRNAPQQIDLRFLEQFPSYVEWRQRTAASGNPSENETTPSIEVSLNGVATPEEQIERSYQLLTTTLEAELLERVREISPAFFETLIMDLLIAMGYGGGRADMGKAIGKSGDGGIDGIIKEDTLGLDIVYMQAKRYAADHSIGRQDIQGFAGSLDGVQATKGIFVTTSSFTKGAIEYAEKIAKRIILIDGRELTKLMVQHGVGVRAKATYEIKRADEDYFSE